MSGSLMPPGSIYRSLTVAATPDGEPDLRHFNTLHPLEKTLVSGAVPIRRAEFGDARFLAHQALVGLGVDKKAASAPITRGDSGMPVFPPDIVGSLSHTRGYRGALVARRKDYASLGLDVEFNAPLPSGVLEQIAVPEELDRLEADGANSAVHLDRVLFCAKEATYKAWFPVARCWLGFEDADITIAADGSFSSQILLPGAPLRVIEGRWAQRGHTIITTAVVPPH